MKTINSVGDDLDFHDLSIEMERVEEMLTLLEGDQNKVRIHPTTRFLKTYFDRVVEYYLTEWYN